MSYPGRCNSILPNDRQALSLLVQHLTELGHRQFAWLGGDKRWHTFQSRCAALVEALSQHGLRLPDKYTIHSDVEYWFGGWKACEILMSRISRRSFPTACVCANGLMARGAIYCLRQHGWRVPEDISVVAVDAARVCEEERPRITGAHATPEKIGQTAAELLLKHAEQNNGDFTDVLISSHLTVRESSGKATQ